jgi:hypothetical protein
LIQELGGALFLFRANEIKVRTANVRLAMVAKQGTARARSAATFAIVGDRRYVFAGKCLMQRGMTERGLEPLDAAAFPH